MNNNEKIIEEILGFDIKVRTNNNEEKILRFDFKNSKESNSMISLNKDYDIYGDYIYTINIRHECTCYSKEMI